MAPFKDISSRLFSERVKQWKQVYNQVYNNPLENFDFFKGWNSSYTQRPIPADEMQRWVDAIVHRVASLNPRRILELGCGTGLLVRSLLPHCTHYLATDLSDVAIAQLQSAFDDQSKLAFQVGDALSIQMPSTERYDVTILNSVIQYFPSLQYLNDVLEKSVSCTASGGHVVVGDVRHFNQLNHFYASVVQFKHPRATPKIWHDAVYEMSIHEEELTVAPAFFYQWAAQHPRVSHVAVLLKEGQDANEMNRFRYDVIIYVEHPTVKQPNVNSIDWQSTETWQYVKSLLAAGEEDAIQLEAIPNRWVAPYTPIVERVLEKKEFDSLNDALVLEIEQVYQQSFFPYLCSEYAYRNDYQVYMTPSSVRPFDRFDAIFYKIGTLTDWLPNLSTITSKEPLHCAYSNNPLKPIIYKKTTEVLKKHVDKHLPEYMQPSIYLFLDELPRTISGKLNTQALPLPAFAMKTSAYKAPSSNSERALVKLWERLLSRTHIGVDDDFFDLGGESLLAIQMLALIKRQFGVDITIAQLHQAPTIAQLVSLIKQPVSKTQLSADPIANALIALRPEGARNPLFLMHPVGGTVFCYYPFVRHFDAEYPVYAIQDPGIESGEFHFDSLKAMAACYVELIRTRQPKGPYLLGGASLGGTLAIEMAWQLKQAGETVDAIIALDNWAAFTDRFKDEARLKQAMLRQHELMKANLKDYKVEHPERWFALNLNRLELVLHYQPVPIVTELLLCKAQELMPEYEAFDDPTNYWQAHSAQPITVFSAPGNHETMLLDANVRIWIRHVNQHIKAVKRDVPLKSETVY